MSGLTDHARTLLEGRNFAHIATVMPDGSPQVSPVWVDVEGDHVIVNTAEGRVKTRNVRRDPRVALSVFDQRNPYDKVLIRGSVTEVTHEGGAEGIEALSQKYTSGPYRGWTPGQQRVILRVRPDHVTD